MTVEIIMTRGLPGGGKSFWSKQQVDKGKGQIKRLSKDDLRLLVDNGKWTKANEKLILKLRDAMIETILADRISVIVDDTNYAPMHEQRLRELAKKHQASFRIQEFDTDIDTCIKRDLQRLNSVGEAVIRKMYDQYVRVIADPPAHVEGAPNAIICDLDGTLAILGNRSPYDASLCEQDTLNRPVADILWRYQEESLDKIVLMSGRQEESRSQTVRWLEANNIRYDALYMRATGDQRKDSIVKRELYDVHILGKYNVDFAIDDRDQVVDMYRRDLGITVFQCNYGNF